MNWIGFFIAFFMLFQFPYEQLGILNNRKTISTTCLTIYGGVVYFFNSDISLWVMLKEEAAFNKGYIWYEFILSSF